MGTRTYACCDECGNTTTRLVEIEGKGYCSRECYLMNCKRLFDHLWEEMLDGKSTKEKPAKTIKFQPKSSTAST